MSDFKKLVVWRKSHALALNVHRVVVRIRGSDHLSLRSQLMRAALSIPANIVEGASQKTGAGFGRFLRIALNSSAELEYHLIVARDIGVIDAKDSDALTGQTIEVRKMLHGLLRAVMQSSRDATPASPGVVN